MTIRHDATLRVNGAVQNPGARNRDTPQFRDPRGRKALKRRLLVFRYGREAFDTFAFIQEHFSGPEPDSDRKGFHAEPGYRFRSFDPTCGTPIVVGSPIHDAVWTDSKPRFDTLPGKFS